MTDLGNWLLNKSIEENLPPKGKILIANLDAPTGSFSSYIAEELSVHLVNGKYVTIVARDARVMESINSETNYQLSGEVSDDTIQSIGNKTGAKFLITGVIRQQGDRQYSFNFKITEVKTAELKGQKTVSFQSDEIIISLLEYKIGDKGQAGIVFYDKGNYNDGWRYLEVAPASTEWRNSEWGAYKKNVLGTRVEIGTGKENTRIILEFLRTIGETGKAAQQCAQLNYGGKNDWFLPSDDELYLMYTNLKAKRIGDFKNVRYRSSTQYNESDSWYRHFGELWKSQPQL